MAIQNSYEKNRNFNQCPFLVTLPQLTVREGSVRVLIKILSKAGKAVDVTLNEILLSDKLDRKYNQHFEGLGKTKSIPQKEISVDIEIEKKNFLVSGSTLILRFLTGNNSAYEVCYSATRESGIVLNYVMSREMSAEEYKQLEADVSIIAEKLKNKKPSLHNLEKKDAERESSVCPIPQIEEYKKALLREKFFLQKEGGENIRLPMGIASQLNWE